MRPGHETCHGRPYCSKKCCQNQDESVKTPAVKPCIVYIIDLPDSVGSKELSAYRSVVAPLVIVTIVG